MKHARKLASLLLALVMVFALATTVAAEGTGTAETAKGSITVDNPIKGQTYTAYKIFNVVYDEATPKHYSYTIDGSSEWFETVKAYADGANSGLTLTLVKGTTTYVVTTTGAFSAPPFADALKADVNGKTGRTLSVADGKATVTDLDLGYYFVTSSIDALCNLTTTNPAVIIHDKNEMPFEKKDDKVSAEVGETVNYTIKGKVPDTTGFDTYTYLITDTMSEGLTFQKDVKVSIGETEITADTVTTWINYKPAAESATGFELTIPVKSYQNQVGAEILVTYSALVNENAVAKISKNSATLTYSNNPSDSTKTDTTTTVEETVYSSKIVIEKYEKGTGTKLEGAEFVLCREAPNNGPQYAALYAVQNDIQYYRWDEATKTVSWVDNIAEATKVTTDNKGEAFFKGLANGTYYLVETKAPAGYNRMTEAKEVTVAGSTTDSKTLSIKAEVANSTGTLLPSTGGVGTTVFYVLGAVLVLGAVVLLVTKKRMNDTNR